MIPRIKATLIPFKYSLLWWIAAGFTNLLLFFFTASCLQGQATSSTAASAGNPTFVVPSFSPSSELKIAAYGDMRFTDTSDVKNTNPRMRKWLAERIGEETPDLLLLSGDMPMRGARAADWDIYRQETASWRRDRAPGVRSAIHIYPTIGNHEVFGNQELGLKNYFAAYPELQGNLYYSVLAGSVEIIALDSAEKHDAGSPQQAWLEAQMAHIPPQVDFIFFLMHFPLMADVQSQFIVNLPSEDDTQLRRYLESQALSAHARFIVVSGHIHNYERFLNKGITYVVTGGGGAKPYPIVIRGEQDLYKDTAFPVFHYLIFQLKNRRLEATMYKVADPTAANVSLEIKDTFSINAK